MPYNDSGVHIFGIRHHGPGSARSLRRALEALRPDAILVEGPPDAAEVLPLLTHPAMRPPVALLIYAPDQPRCAAYYPFASFSPEWQAIHYGLTQGIPVRFIDLPQAHQLVLTPTTDDQPPTADDRPPAVEGERGREGEEEAGGGEDIESPISNLQSPISSDPLGWLARAAGYGDGERWWEQMVEQRRDGADLFAAVLEAMAALREAALPDEDPTEARREAWMRQAIRGAQRDGFGRIAVVCGAWHAPALAGMPPAQRDAALLRGLPKIKVQATWVPWTYDRLAYASGYGAGVTSPGWYEHLWNGGTDAADPAEVTTRWMTRVARLLRAEGLDASVAHVVDAVRLAEALAALRERPLPGLPELNESSQAVFCFGGDLPMRLIHDRLIVGVALGQVPDETPMVPLQQDLLHEQRRLRLPAEARQRDLDLDLRKPTDLGRSHLLHRLNLLGIPWGRLDTAPSAGARGTFHELWQVQWRPELAVALIVAGVWGNSIADAAEALVRDAADRAADLPAGAEPALPALTRLVDQALLADLPDAVAHLMARLEVAAALSSDVAHLMDALPPLANVLRYGSVRRSDAGAVGHVVDGMVARICIGLPGACAALDDQAAGAMFERIVAVNGALALLRDAAHTASWHAVLRRLVAASDGRRGIAVHGLIAGRCCRILLDAKALDADEAARLAGLALAPAVAPAEAAAWIEGLLKGSGLLLVHDAALWRLLDGWLAALPGEAFTQTLPLLRRTFATFTAPERRQMGERARAGTAPASAHHATPDSEIDPARGEALLRLVAQMLGLDVGPTT